MTTTSCYWFLSILLFWRISGTLATATVTTVCEGDLTDGANAVVKCQINTTEVTGCVETPSTVTFTFLSSEGASNTVCRTNYTQSCTNPEVNCGCASSSAGTNVYQISFKADKTLLSGGSVSCTVNCKPSLSREVAGPCNPLSFTVTTSVTTSSSSIEKVLNAPDDKESAASSIRALTTGIIVSMVITGLVAFF